MPWVSAPSPKPSPWVSVPSLPSAASPPLTLAPHDPSQMIGMGMPNNNPFNVFGGIKQTAIDPLMELLSSMGFGAKLTSKTMMGQPQSESDIQRFLAMQMAPQADAQAFGGEIASEVGMDPKGLLAKLIGGVTQATPMMGAVGVPAARGGLKMAHGVTQGGEAGAAQYEQGMGNIIGLLLPTLLDASAPKSGAARAGAEVAGAGMDIKGMLANLISDLKPKMTVTEPKFMRDAAASAKQADAIDWASAGLGPQDRAALRAGQAPTGGGQLKPGRPSLEETMKNFLAETEGHKGPNEAGAGMDIKKWLVDLIAGPVKGESPAAKPVASALESPSRREFLKKAPAAVGAAATGAEVPKVGDVRAFDSMGENVAKFFQDITEARPSDGRVVEELRKQYGLTDQNIEQITDMARYNSADLSPEVVKAVGEATHNWHQEASNLGLPGDPLEFAKWATKNWSQKYLDSWKVQKADMQAGRTATGGEPPITPTATEKLTQRGIPDAATRVAPGEPLPKKAYNKEQLKLVDDFNRGKFDPTRNNAGIDLFGPFRDAALRDQQSRGSVPLLRSERTGSRVSSLIERAVEGSLPGAGPFQRFRAKQQEALSGLADSVVKSISDTTGRPEDIGRKAQDSLLRAQEGLKTQAGQLYAEVDTLAQGAKVKTAAVKGFAKDLQKEMRAESKLVPPKALERARDIVNRLAKAPDQVTFSAAQDARSDMAAMARASGDLIPGKAAGVAKKVAQMLDSAMEEAAKGNPELMTKLRQANSIWKETTQTFNDSVISKMAQADPEKVHTLLAKAPLEDLRRAKKLLPPKVMQEVKAQIVRDMIDTATEGELVKPSPELEQLGIGKSSVQPKLKGPSLRKALERFGEDRLKEVYTEQELRGIQSVAEVADRVGKNQGGWVSTIINYPLVYAAIHGGVTADVGTLAGAGAAAGSVNLLARVLTKPWGARTIREFLQASAISGNRAAFWGARVGELMKQEKGKKEKGKATPSPSPTPTASSRP